MKRLIFLQKYNRKLQAIFARRLAEKKKIYRENIQ